MADPFDGTWLMNRERSTVYDRTSQKQIREPLLAQTVIIRTEGDVQHNELHVQQSENCLLKLGFSCRFNDITWVPYNVLAIEGDPPKVEADGAIAGFHPTFEVGQPFEECVQIKADDRTHYQLTRAPGGGRAYYVRMRRMLDADSYVAVVMDTDGIPANVKYFERKK